MARLRILKLAGIALLSVAACGHEVESPAVSANPPGAAGQKGPADPDLVCVEQLTTKVTLHGEGFTPFPSQTLQSTVQLLMPSVSLTRTTALDGSPATGAANVADDVNDLAHSHIHWTSQQEMAFDVSPELNLSPGLYDVTVTSRDGVHSATFPGALAGVPRPAITSAAPDIACDAQEDQVFILTGSNFLDAGGALPTVNVNGKELPVSAVEACADVPGNHAAGKVRTCTRATFTVPKGSFEPGVVNVTLRNPGTASCSSTEAIPITIVPPPSVTAIVADVVCDAQADVPMTVHGSGFLQIGGTLPLVRIGTQTYGATKVSSCTPVAGTFSEGAVQTCTEVSFAMKQGTLPSGNFDVSVTNPPPAACHSTEKLTVAVTEPPKVATIAADLVCDAQGDQSMVLTGAGFLKIGASLPTVKLGTSSFTPSAIEGCVAVVGTFTEIPVSACTGLKFTIPKGALPEGSYPVVVSNPDPASCISSEAVALYVAPPPAVTGVGQIAICDAQAAQTVNIQGTGLLTLTKTATTTYPVVTIDGVAYTPSAASGCTAVAGTFLEGTAQECTGLTIQIPKNALATGSYPISVANPAPAGCSVASMVALTVEPPPTVTAVAPTSLCAGGGTLTLTGQGFVPTPTVILQASGKPNVVSTGATVNGAHTVTTAQIPSGAVANTTYDVVLTNPDTCTDAPPHKTVQIVPGPSLFFADPEVVYNGIKTRVTLYVTALNLPLASVTMTPTGQTSPVITLTSPTVVASNKVQVTVPNGTAPGTYDITLTDSLTCPAVLAAGIRVTGTTTIALKNVVQPFGWTSSNTDITIFRDATAVAPNNAPFVALPRVFLNPTNPAPTDIAIQLTATSFTGASTLTSVVAKGAPVHAYDLVVVNPDGTVGVLANAFSVTASPPPTVANASPSSVVNSSGQAITFSGKDFRTSVLSISQCADAMGNLIASPPASIASGAITCNGQQVCTQAAVMDATGLNPGSSCVIKLTNGDNTFALYSAIGVTGSSLNLSNPHPGTQMTLARRALLSAAGNATSAARFVYAIGGDDGINVTAPYSSAESASVDFFGNMGTWSAQRYALAAGRSFAGITQIGNYLYVCGGNDGTNVLATCARGMILNPLESPRLDVSDLPVGMTGLDAGYYYYRVAATFSASDLDNPAGESLPSDEAVVKAPVLPGGLKVGVRLSWTAPVDALGAPLPNVSGYRIYRTAAVNGAANSEVLLATIVANTYTDSGQDTPGTAKPLPLGSTGQWAALASMATPRKGHAMSWGVDPANANAVYAYSFFGVRDNASPPTATTAYEYLPVTVLGNGHQVAASGATAWKTGASATTAPRWQMGAFHVDSNVSSLATGTATYIFIGGGITNAGAGAGTVEAGVVSAGGDLGTLSLQNGFGPTQGGYAAIAANNQLFVFGGLGAAPSNAGKSTTLVAPMPGLKNWNSNPVTLNDPLYLMGSAVQSSFIFLVGGETAAGPPIVATRNTEILVW